MAGFKGHGLPGVQFPPQLLNYGGSEVGVEIGWGLPHQLFPGVAQARACLAVNVQDDTALVLQEERVGGVIHECPKTLFALPERLLSELDPGDVAGEAERADDLAIVVTERHPGGGNPPHAAVEPGLLFLFTHHRLAGADDLLFVRVGRPGMFRGEEVEIRLAKRLRGVTQAKVSSQGLVDADEVAGGVLEINVVGKIIHQRVEQVSFLNQRLLGLPALVAHETAPGPVQGFAQPAEDRADQHEKNQGGHVVCRGEVEEGKLPGQEVVRGGGAENRGQQPGPKAAEVRGNHDRREEGHVRDRLPQHRPERPADQQRGRCGEHGHAVGNQSRA